MVTRIQIKMTLFAPEHTPDEIQIKKTFQTHYFVTIIEQDSPCFT